MTRKVIMSLTGKVLENTAILTWYKSTPFFVDSKRTQDEFSDFKIYRKQCGDFEFGKDYEEFFCGLVPDESELIFQGALECSNNRKYTFQDKNVEIGRTYAYFVKSKNTQWFGSVPLKVRDPRVWWSYDELCKQIRQLKKGFAAQIKISACGTTIEGRNIHGLNVINGKFNKKFSLILCIVGLTFFRNRGILVVKTCKQAKTRT